MIPETVSFTGYNVYPRETAIMRVYHGPVPAAWTLIRVKTEAYSHSTLESWLLENIDGRFGLLINYPYVHIYFENEIDAVMFRLKGGDDLIKDGSFG